jgi:group I intron endonuclease
MKIIGVYQIWSKTHTDRCYVGSAVNINNRWNRHKSDLNKNNKHHSPQLQRHYDKYGIDDLVFEVIESGEYFNKNHLLSREQMWMNRFHYKNIEIPYFNCNLIAGSQLGTHWSEESKLNQSKRLKGKNSGRHVSEETKDKLHNIHLGKHYSPTTEFKKGYNFGKPSPRKGKPPWNKGQTIKEYSELSRSGKWLRNKREKLLAI